MLGWVCQVFGEMESSSPAEPQLAQYQGGDMRMQVKAGGRVCVWRVCAKLDEREGMNNSRVDNRSRAGSLAGSLAREPALSH